MILCLSNAVILFRAIRTKRRMGDGDGILRITADKTAIQARWVEKVTFTVKLLGTKDVSEESTMNLILVKERESGEENLD